jgi:hypothetical protein
MAKAPKNTRSIEAIQTPALEVADHVARQQRAALIEQYAQKTNRRWHCLAELLDSGGDKQFRPLLNSLLKGEFDSNGRCRVLYLHPWSPPRRMTPDFVESILEFFKATPFTVRDQYVSHGWIPRHMAESWAKAHNIKLEKTSRRGRPRGQRQDVNKNDAQYVRLVARYRAEGESEHKAVRMALENGELDRTSRKYWSDPKSEAIRIRRKFREGQRG